MLLDMGKKIGIDISMTDCDQGTPNITRKCDNPLDA